MTEKKAPQANSATDKSAHAKKTEEAVTKKQSGVEVMLEGTEAGAIWNEIKDKAIDLFAIPDQKIHQHAAPYPIEPSKLYLITKATSALPAIETAVGNKFNVELMDKYVVVSRAVSPSTKR